MDATNYQQHSTRALLYGFLGIAGFSLTLPMTRIAITAFDPVFVGLGRALVAALLASMMLIATRQKIPPLRYWWRFALVAGGVVIGFPLLSSLAMRSVPAAHGAVITGLIPIATALAATWRGGERQSSMYWASSLACCVLVLAFAFSNGAGRLQFADMALLGGVIAAGIGYAEGTLLARIFGYWQVICWALLLSAPFIVVALWYRGATIPPQHFLSAPFVAWFGFGYVSVISMFGAFMLWYRGLALGGIAQVGQLQFLQPFMTMLAAAFCFGEVLHANVIVFALGIALLIFLGRHSVQGLRPVVP